MRRFLSIKKILSLQMRVFILVVLLCHFQEIWCFTRLTNGFYKRTSEINLIPSKSYKSYYPFSENESNSKLDLIDSKKSKEPKINTKISKLNDPVKSDDISNNGGNHDWKESEKLWRGVIFTLCLAWASQFSVIKEIYASEPLLDPSMYSAIRFTICGIIFSPAILRATQNKDLLGRGLLVGCTVFIGYLGQAAGLQSASAGYAAFICSLASVWVAILEGFLTGIYKRQTFFSVFFAVVGTALLELSGEVVPEMNMESLYLLLMPIGFGTGYVALSSLIRRYPDDVEAVTGLKLGTAGVVCTLWALSNGHSVSEIPAIFQNPVAGPGLIYTSVLTTAFAVWIQSKAFKRVSASDASIILSSEPVWAGLFAWQLLGETFNYQECVGAAVIIFASLSNELKLLERMGLEESYDINADKDD